MEARSLAHRDVEALADSLSRLEQQSLQGLDRMIELHRMELDRLSLLHRPEEPETVPQVRESPARAEPAPDESGVARANLWRLLEGKVAGADLAAPDGTRLALAGDPITPGLVDQAQRAGRLADLILDMSAPAGGGAEA